MSIATQIQRLLNAKSAIKSSITNKSVTVGETVMLDSYHTYISQIGSQSNVGPADVLSGKKAFGNNGQYFNGTALSVATSANNAVILNGFTAYDNKGQLLTGNAMPTATTALNNRIMNGYTAYDNKGNLLKGNAFASIANATNAKILKGYTAYLNNGTLLVGNALSTTTNATNDKILKGYTAYNSAGTLLTGNAFGNATNATNNSILNGYTAYLNNGTYIKGNYKPLQVQTGTVSETDNVYTISTTFTPKGFAMFSDNISESATRDYVFCLFDLAGTKTVTGYCTYSYKTYLYQNWLSLVGNDVTSVNSDLVSNYIYNHDASDAASDVHYNPFMIINNLANDAKVSKLELGMSNADSQIVDTYGSDWLLSDALVDQELNIESAYTDESINTNNFEFTSATVSYSSTGAIITVPTEMTHEDTIEIDEVESPITFTREVYCKRMNYIIWGE